MSDEKLKEEIKQVVTNLGNIEFTIEDELEFCKQVLKLKEQECEELKAKLLNLLGREGIRQSEKEFYDEQFYQLKAENEECIKDNEYLKTIIKDFTQEVVKLKQTITEIRKIAQGVRNYLQVPHPKDVRYEMDIILQKISECEVEDE